MKIPLAKKYMLSISLLLILMISLVLAGVVVIASRQMDAFQRELGTTFSSALTLNNEQALIDNARYLSARLYRLLKNLNISGLNEEIEHVSLWLPVSRFVIVDRNGLVVTDGSLDNPDYNQPVSISDELRSQKWAILHDKETVEFEFVIGYKGTVLGYALLSLNDEDLQASIDTLDARMSSMWNRMKEGIALILIGALGLTILIGTLLSRWLSRVLSRPLLEMGVAAETIARGHYDYRLTVRSQDELGELAAVLNKMAHQIELKQATEERLHTLVENMVGLTGQAYFDKATYELCRWFDADGANIGQILEGSWIQTISMNLHGEQVQDFEYLLEGTPCQNAIKLDTCLYPRDVCSQFPDDKVLKKLGIQGYAGAPIRDQRGITIGVVWVASRKPLQVPPQWEDVLNIISAKTGAEIERMRVEEALSLSLEKYRDLVETTQDFVWEIDHRGVYTYCSPQTEAMLGYAPKEMLGKAPFEFMAEAEAERIALQFQHFLDLKAPFSDLENINLHKDGHEVILETSGLPFFDAAGKLAGYRGIDRDITERKTTEANLRESEKRFRKVIDGLPNIAVQGYNKNRQVIYWNKASSKLYGYSSDEATGRQLEDLIIPGPMREAVIESINAWLNKGQEILSGELRLKCKDGGQVPVYTNYVMLKLQSDEPELFCIDVDLTQQKRAQAELENLASFDRLTQLPNRFLLDSELSQRIEEAARFEQKLAILFIDLDNFKLVNDSMGHACGDILLTKVSRRISSGLRKYDLLARFGGDEFILMMPQVEEATEIALVADKILREFSRPFNLNGRGLYITGSIGISLFPQDGRTAGELIKNADAAMYRAKESGRNRHQFFTQDMNDELRRHQHIANQLRTSLANPDFQLFYQPQVDLNTGKIVSCEALIRWSPLDGEEISPGEFIPVAEKSELIILIGAWVIDEACRQKAKWKREGLAEIRIDINFSGRQFFAKEVCDMLYKTTLRYGLSPTEIGIELTEHTLIQADSLVLSRLQQIHEAGVHIAIDDFGTGYSSLGYLKRFPVDSLKIDREFVRDAPTDNSDRSIMEAIVAMGHSLGLQVVVEGIETEEQLRLAHELGCDFAQGFFLHKPMEEKNFKPIYLGNIGWENHGALEGVCE